MEKEIVECQIPRIHGETIVLEPSFLIRSSTPSNFLGLAGPDPTPPQLGPCVGLENGPKGHKRKSVSEGVLSGEDNISSRTRIGNLKQAARKKGRETQRLYGSAVSSSSDNVTSHGCQDR
ncbi:hypothetical protein ACFE04_010231 [Oxalis oulophora]